MNDDTPRHTPVKMATVTNRGADRASALFQKGHRFYKARQYDLAEKAFLKAMDLCVCGISIQKQPRIDHDILTGIKKKDLKGALTNLSASQRCNNRLHLDALDSLIATYETQARLEEALEFALKMVNLSPREPKSYLRLGKVLRLKNQQTVAYYNYKQGVELVKRKSPNHALLSKLEAQKDKVLPLATFDPMTELPIELVGMIFGFLNTRTLCRGLCVSKTWKTVLATKALSNQWRIQDYTFTRLNQPSTPRFLSSFTSNWNYAGHSLTELSVDGCAQFLKICKLERLFRFFQDLKVLKLREPRAILSLGALPENTKKPKLTNLYLGHGIQPATKLLHQLLESSSNSLEELSVFKLFNPNRDGQEYWDLHWPKMEKLKVIRLSTSDDFDPMVDLGAIIEKTPNVEEAWVDYFYYVPGLIRLCWRRLQSLFLGEHMMPSLFGARQDLSNRMMREMHIEADSELMQLYESEFTRIHNGRLKTNFPFRKMEKVSLLSREIEQSTLELFVKPGLESGVLRELHVDPLPVQDFFQDHRAPTLPDWFRSDSITYLNLTGFTREGLHEHRLFDDVVLAIASCFPSLRIVDISDELFPDTLLAKLINKGVKTIYCRQGPPRIELREWASSKFGAQIIKGLSPHIPSSHPDRFRNPNLPFINSSNF
ncbi:hypothetical protein F4781DRAFT_405048 [Annulohypoxylon bovei var. microspora]|nr:hypothetical protein F4781DRAFT_405048 [Annulohypoxylon bovei var. microspora]